MTWTCKKQASILHHSQESLTDFNKIKSLKKRFINHCIGTTGSAIHINQKAENEHLHLE